MAVMVERRALIETGIGPVLMAIHPPVGHRKIHPTPGRKHAGTFFEEFHGIRHVLQDIVDVHQVKGGGGKFRVR